MKQFAVTVELHTSRTYVVDAESIKDAQLQAIEQADEDWHEDNWDGDAPEFDAKTVVPLNVKPSKLDTYEIEFTSVDTAKYKVKAKSMLEAEEKAKKKAEADGWDLAQSYISNEWINGENVEY